MQADGQTGRPISQLKLIRKVGKLFSTHHTSQSYGQTDRQTDHHTSQSYGQTDRQTDHHTP